MRMRTILLIIGIFVNMVVVAPAVAQATAFRAFWADAFHQGFKSTAEIDTMVARAKTGNYNAIVAEVLAFKDSGTGAHGAYWNSSIVPKATDISGGIDPLAYLCQKAHTEGIEVHAWLVTYRISTAWPPPNNSTITAHPEWVTVPLASMGAGPTSMEGKYFLDPGSPEVQEYLIGIVRELVTNYPIDGINWDYIRYTQSDAGYPASTSYAKSGLERFKRITGYTGTPPASGNTSWNDFRRRTISELVRRSWAEMVSITGNPRQPLRHTADLYCSGNAPSDFASSGAYALFQDWRYWMEMGWLDAGIPMNYKDDRNSTHASWYRNWIDAAVGWRYDRHMYCGQGNYMNSKANSVAQMQYVYGAGADGSCNYAYYSTADENDDGVEEADFTWYTYVSSPTTGIFTSPVSTPGMPWRNPALANQGAIWGRVIEAAGSQPIDDATVQVGALPAVKTDGNGYYVVTRVPATATYSITVTKAGYPTAIHNNISVPPAVLIRDDFALGGSVPPVIFGVQATGVTANAATILWTTDLSSTSRVEYGLTTSYGSFSPLDSTYVTSHSVALTGLNANTLYHYRVISANAAGTTTSGDYTFTTTGSVADIVIDNLDSGWANTSPDGNTWASNNLAGLPKIGTDYLYGRGTGNTTITRSCTWTPNILVAGLYDVYVFYQIGANRTITAPYTVYYNGGQMTSVQNQYSPTSGGGWFLIGTDLPLLTGTAGHVLLTNNTADTLNVSADAAKFVFKSPLAPTITQHPVSQDICAGGNAQFIISAGGSGTLTYQWQLNGDNLVDGGAHSGVNTSVLSINGAVAGNAGPYRCSVTNAGGSVLSNAATLTVRLQTQIEQEPQSLAVCRGETAQMIVVATGDGTLAYQWKKNGSNLSDGGKFSGAITAMLTVVNVERGEVAAYQCLITGGCGSVTSATATLALRNSTTVIQQPVDQVVALGGTAQFSLIGAGDGTLAYQWSKGGIALGDGGHVSGAMTDTLTIAGADSGDAGTYQCLVTGTCGGVNSSTVTLTVNGNAVPADVNGDLHVDSIDFDAFSACYNGPTNLVTRDCLLIDFNGDHYVDSIDFDTFSACYNGPTNPPGC